MFCLCICPYGEPKYPWKLNLNIMLSSHLLRVGRLDALHSSVVCSLAAAKFHSAALTEAGDLYTWGYGRGGRLGELAHVQRLVRV